MYKANFRETRRKVNSFVATMPKFRALLAISRKVQDRSQRCLYHFTRHSRIERTSCSQISTLNFVTYSARTDPGYYQDQFWHRGHVRLKTAALKQLLALKDFPLHAGLCPPFTVKKNSRRVFFRSSISRTLCWGCPSNLPQLLTSKRASLNNVNTTKLVELIA